MSSLLKDSLAAQSPKETLLSAQPVDTRARRWGQLFFAISAGLVALMALRLLFNPIVGDDHYTYLAQSLARGDLTVDNLPAGYSDYALWQGHKYLPFGPLPGLLLIPFLPLIGLFGGDDAWVGALFTLLNVFLFARVLERAGVWGERRNWSLLLFFGGTVYFSVALIGGSWAFAHVIATTTLLLAAHEALGKQRPLLIGLFLGLAAATRMTTIFALPFFMWLLWTTGKGSRITDERSETNPAPNPQSLTPTHAVRSVALLALGLAGPVALVALYNYARFGNPLESGYALADLYFPVLEEARRQGLFSLAHIPKNLFMMLLQGPLPHPSENAPVLQFPYLRPSPWGMGLFFTSAALLYAFRGLRARLREPLTMACWLGVLSLMLPIISYYGVGIVQFGYRYALDFLPFLLILAARGLPNPMTTGSRVLIITCVAVNLWGAVLLSRGLL